MTTYYDDWSESGYTENEVITRLNGMGDQYSEFQTLFNAHNHDDLYYKKEDSDNKFWNFTDTYGDYDKLDGYHGEEIRNLAIPLGGIFIWGGAFGAIPENMHLCDGTNDTPYLCGKMIVGAGNAYNVGNIGGANSITLNSTVTINNHTLTIDEIPSHVHYYVDEYANWTYIAWRGSPLKNKSSINGTMGNTGSGQGHNHTGSITSDSIDNRPAFMILPLIKKIL
jgi:hypothetical protein